MICINLETEKYLYHAISTHISLEIDMEIFPDTVAHEQDGSILRLYTDTFRVHCLQWYDFILTKELISQTQLCPNRYCKY